MGPILFTVGFQQMKSVYVSQGWTGIPVPAVFPREWAERERNFGFGRERERDGNDPRRERDGTGKNSQLVQNQYYKKDARSTCTDALHS